jgi:hypothetical protein
MGWGESGPRDREILLIKTLRAFFDGQVLRPEEPPGLKPDQPYLVTIEREEHGEKEGQARPYPLTAILRLATDLGAPDLSTQHDLYAHGRPEEDKGGSGAGSRLS